MASTFRLFRIKDAQVVEDVTIQKRAVALYRIHSKCSNTALDPNVWGIGWSPDGTRFYLLIQATVHQPCGAPSAFIGMTIKLIDGSVLEQLSTAETKHKFRLLLPQELLLKR